MSAQQKIVHQDIVIDENKRRKLVRQDRLLLASDNVIFRTGKHEFPVIDCSPFGIALKGSEDLPQGLQGLQEQVTGNLFIGNYEIGELLLKKVRAEALQDGPGYKLAFAVIGDPIPVSVIRAVVDTQVALGEAQKEFNAHGSLPDQYKWSIQNMKGWLQTLEDRIHALEKKNFEIGTNELVEFENTVCTLVAKNIDSSIQPFYKEIAKAFHSIPEKDRQQALGYFREALGSLLYQSYYAHRAYTKPRGYAGDFEMMSTVYRRENRGNTLFAKCLHRYFVEVPEAQAVRNRAEYLQTKIIATLQKKSSSPRRILSLACGPAMEIQSLIENRPELFTQDLEIHLLDQDEFALKSAQRDIETLMRRKSVSARVFYHNLAIKNVIEQGFPVKDFDLIYSAGLFDYFTDPVAFFAAKQMVPCLKQDGLLVIGNFNVNIPNQFGMVAIMDWHLIYRSEEEMKKLFSAVGKVEVEKEPTGINLFACIRK